MTSSLSSKYAYAVYKFAGQKTIIAELLTNSKQNIYSSVLNLLQIYIRVAIATNSSLAKYAFSDVGSG